MTALGMIANDIYLSFPRTPSMQSSRVTKLFRDTVKSHNRKIKSTIQERLEEGGYLLAIAGSGATDKPKVDDQGTLVMGGLAEGTISLMQKRHTLVLPMAVWLEGDAPVYEFCDIPRAVTTREEAHAVMYSIAERLNERDIEKRFMYTPGNIARSVASTAINGNKH